MKTAVDIKVSVALTTTNIKLVHSIKNFLNGQKKVAIERILKIDHTYTELLRTFQTPITDHKIACREYNARHIVTFTLSTLLSISDSGIDAQFWILTCRKLCFRSKVGPFHTQQLYILLRE